MLPSNNGGLAAIADGRNSRAVGPLLPVRCRCLRTRVPMLPSNCRRLGGIAGRSHPQGAAPPSLLMPPPPYESTDAAIELSAAWRQSRTVASPRQGPASAHVAASVRKYQCCHRLSRLGGIAAGRIPASRGPCFLLMPLPLLALICRADTAPPAAPHPASAWRTLPWSSPGPLRLVRQCAP